MYRSLEQTTNDLEKNGHLIRINEEVDANLEMAEIHRRVFQSSGPAILFTNVKGCSFPAVSNLFGSKDRVHFLFRSTLATVQKLIDLKVDPASIRNHWKSGLSLARAGCHTLPKKVRRGAIFESTTDISQLPQVISWPKDGGAFVTLPQVYSESALQPGWKKSNLGMYRVQLSGNEYRPDRQVGLHYQIHRGIGVHHQEAIASKKPFRVNIFVGGTPAMTLAAVMPLPEGMSELTFAGALAGHRIPMVARAEGPAIYADADFCICGTVDPEQLLPEGPFGDHLGYYSLQHEYPVLNVEKVYHRKGAIWPFTVVGRPPQEDTFFGEIIHEITGPVIPTVLSGVKGVHAVDEAGVHPLLLAIGSERYTPFQDESHPQELLTQANAILGQGQLSLAKFLFILNEADVPDLRLSETGDFFEEILQRVEWSRDLHFQTNTTIDTLDYSGSGVNRGSKVVVAARGPKVRSLSGELPAGLTLPDGFCNPKICRRGILVIEGPSVKDSVGMDGRGDDSVFCRSEESLLRFCKSFTKKDSINQFPLIVLVDESDFVARSWANFLWVVFTRTNPASDVLGIEPFIHEKHFGVHGSLVLDARKKNRHAPALVEDPKVMAKVDALAAKGGPLARYL
ncbi:MAG: UbiD family decarboxylase [Pirellulaceae bacterium]|nr:UbiD family decarboxylase [Pirellulaceae bacterium]